MPGFFFVWSAHRPHGKRLFIFQPFPPLGTENGKNANGFFLVVGTHTKTGLSFHPVLLLLRAAGVNKNIYQTWHEHTVKKTGKLGWDRCTVKRTNGFVIYGTKYFLMSGEKYMTLHPILVNFLQHEIFPFFHLAKLEHINKQSQQEQETFKVQIEYEVVWEWKEYHKTGIKREKREPKAKTKAVSIIS